MKPQVLTAISPPSVKRQSECVGDYAYRAIKKYLNHILKQEKGVLAHGDPEFLHQMRVGLRRLRTARAAFDSAIVFPDEVSDHTLKHLGKVLGRVRDLDVLKSWLVQYRDRAKVTKPEKKVLQTLEQRLEKRRQKYVAQMDKLLVSDTYKRPLKALKRWLKQPQYQPIASLPLAVALPDLQLPLIGQLLLHPGWLVVDDTDPSELKQVHGLRKAIKGVRYQMALFSDFYGEAYGAQVNEFKQMQDLLGELQDEVVLQEYLVKTLGANWAQKLPSLERYFQHQHGQLWQQWLELRSSYLSANQRHSLHQLFLE